MKLSKSIIKLNNIDTELKALLSTYDSKLGGDNDKFTELALKIKLLSDVLDLKLEYRDTLKNLAVVGYKSQEIFRSLPNVYDRGDWITKMDFLLTTTMSMIVEQQHKDDTFWINYFKTYHVSHLTLLGVLIASVIGCFGVHEWIHYSMIQKQQMILNQVITK